MSSSQSNATIEHHAVCLGVKTVEMNLTSPIIFTAYSGALLCIPGILIASFGNFMTFYTICTNRSLQTTLNVLIAVLSVTDMLVGIVLQPLFLLLRFQELHLSLDCDLRQGYRLCLYTTTGISIFVICMIGVDTVIATAFPLKSRTWNKKRNYVIAIITVIIIGGMVIILAFREILRFKILVIFVSVFYFGSLIVFTISYITVICLANAAQKRIVRDIANAPAKHVLRMRRTRRLRTTAIIFTCFYLCTLPKILSSSVAFFAGKDVQVFYHVQIWTALLLFANSSLNPFIYHYRREELRENVISNMRKMLNFFCRKDNNIQSAQAQN